MNPLASADGSYERRGKSGSGGTGVGGKVSVEDEGADGAIETLPDADSLRPERRPIPRSSSLGDLGQTRTRSR
jgi:hypothetical protein